MKFGLSKLTLNIKNVMGKNLHFPPHVRITVSDIFKQSSGVPLPLQLVWCFLFGFEVVPLAHFNPRKGSEEQMYMDFITA